MRRLLLAAVLFTILPAAGYGAGYRSVLIRDVPHVKQKPDFCGEACAEMYLRKIGYKTDQDAVFDKAGLSPALGRGCYTRELQTALKAIGFDIGKVWYRVAAERPADLSAQFAALHADLLKGVPSIICMHYDDRPRTTEHFRLILGYDATKDEVIYHEPAVKNGGYRRMKRSLLLKLWPLKYRRDAWTVVRMPLKRSGRLRIAAASKTFTDADFAQHIMQLKKKLPHAGFHIIVQKPFVVVGDETKSTVASRSTRTVKWAVDKLKALYFKKDPTHIIDVWLFKDKTSYRKHTKSIFGDTPSTPFGYYSSYHKALVMNISTGGGTLVHEIVHPFIESNFPACPSWFNEGLASLYEQCGERDGRIKGFTNWRLKGLQQAIARGSVPSFKKLTSTTTRQFYNEDRGTNYSQARYLCYYLQEKGLLVKYYHAFVKNSRTDPTGYATLQKTLGAKDMPAFQKGWEKWVTGLRYGR